jgi:hypothetical protein
LYLAAFGLLYMLIMKTKESIPQVFAWCADSRLSDNEKNLAGIRQWWACLDGKTIIWEVFSGTREDMTKPVTRERLIVESPLLEGIVLRWRERGVQKWNSIPVQHLVLNYSLKQLDIIPSIQDCFGSKHRVKVLN